MFDTNPFMQNSAAFERLVKQVPRSSALAYYEAKFQAGLKKIPTPGQGHGCHPYLLGLSSLGLLASHTEDEIFVAIRVAISEGRRVVSDKEIWDAIKRALVDTFPTGGNPSAYPSVEIARRKKLNEAEAAKVKSHVLSFSTGPVNLDSEEFRHAHGFQLERQAMASLYPEAFNMIQLIRELYAPEDLLYIGPERMEDGGIGSIRPAGEWILFFKAQQKAILERIGNEGWSSSEPSAFLMDLGLRFSHIVPNSMTGCFGKTKSGGLSLRCDDSVCGFNYAIIDFDDFGLDKQAEILHCLCEAMDLRICAVVHTGGKGYHALVKINGVDSLDAWNKKVRDGLFPTFEALGADPACANPSRGFRLPGVYRWETSTWQRLIFVNREGVKI